MLPTEVDMEIARLKLESMKVAIDNSLKNRLNICLLSKWAPKKFPVTWFMCYKGKRLQLHLGSFPFFLYQLKIQ